MRWPWKSCRKWQVSARGERLKGTRWWRAYYLAFQDILDGRKQVVHSGRLSGSDGQVFDVAGCSRSGLGVHLAAADRVERSG